MVQKILLIDDREDNLFSLETILEPDGYQFVKASSGRQALKILLNEFDFALILMDVKMPNLNGFETAALIFEREKLKHIPIIFITANSYGEENMIRGYRTGAIDYIYKPINPELLRAKVAVFADLYKKSQQLILQEQKILAINKNLQEEIKERQSSSAKIFDLNRRLLQNIDNLEKVNKELDRFAFMASHDLQEPLRKIRTFSDRIFNKYRQSLDAESVKDFQRIHNATQRMQDLINDILEFSKLGTAGRQFEQTNLTPLVREVIEELQQAIRDKNAQVELAELPTLPVHQGLMKPLFYNLISNALKYARKNVPPRINIFSAPLPEGEERENQPKMVQYHRIYVSDNGIGFRQEYAEQIFEMFKRLHGNDEYGGTGVGLALCKKIMEKHNGHISALSRENEGATFIVSVPVRQDQQVLA